MKKSVVKHPTVFLDRDGTIIRCVDILTDPVQLELLPGAAEAIAGLNRAGFLVIAITNQPIIEKGLLTLEALDHIHDVLRNKLAAYGAQLDAIYTCPHRYRPERQCVCRKPGTKLVSDAQADFPIDIESSWFVGDRLRDVETGRQANLKTILVQTGGGSDDEDDQFFPETKPDYVAGDLRVAATIITSGRL